MNEWHVSAEVLERFASEIPTIDDVTAASTEAHLATCSRCQLAFAEISDSPQLDELWHEIVDRIDQSELGLEERIAQRFGIDSAHVRLVAATPALKLSALGAVVGVIVAVVLAARSADAEGIFLVVAPIVPAVLIALTFLPGADPAGEAGVATPVFGFSLVVRRALTIELFAFALLAVGSVFVPSGGESPLGWLIPGLALSLGTMAVGSRWPATHAALGLSAAWIGVVFASTSTVPGLDVAGSVVFARTGQMVLALVAVGATVVIAANRRTLFQEVG